MQLYLIRHPPPAVALGICYGQTDLAVAQGGYALEKLASDLRRQLPAGARFFSSPLQRCRALAERLHADVSIDSRLQEMNFGTWEMQPWSAIPREQLDAWAADPIHFRPPNGEAPGALRERVLAFVAEQREHKHRDIALVTHAGVIKVLVGHVEGLADKDWLALSVGFGSLTRLSID